MEARGEARGDHERPEEGPDDGRRHEQVAGPVARAGKEQSDEAGDEVARLSGGRVARVPPEEEHGAEDAEVLEVGEVREPERHGDDDVRRSRDRSRRRAPLLLRDAVEKRRDGRAHQRRRQARHEVVVAEDPDEQRRYAVLPEGVMADVVVLRGRMRQVPVPPRVPDVPADDLLGRHHVARAARAQVTAAQDAEQSPERREGEPCARGDHDDERRALGDGPGSRPGHGQRTLAWTCHPESGVAFSRAARCRCDG